MQNQWDVLLSGRKWGFTLLGRRGAGSTAKAFYGCAPAGSISSFGNADTLLAFNPEIRGEMSRYTAKFKQTLGIGQYVVR
jgi:hypothetical protein